MAIYHKLYIVAVSSTTYTELLQNLKFHEIRDSSVSQKTLLHEILKNTSYQWLLLYCVQRDRSVCKSFILFYHCFKTLIFKIDLYFRCQMNLEQIFLIPYSCRKCRKLLVQYESCEHQNRSKLFCEIIIESEIL